MGVLGAIAMLAAAVVLFSAALKWYLKVERPLRLRLFTAAGAGFLVVITLTHPFDLAQRVAVALVAASVAFLAGAWDATVIAALGRFVLRRTRKYPNLERELARRGMLPELDPPGDREQSHEDEPPRG